MNKVYRLLKDIVFNLKLFKYNQYRVAEARSRAVGRGAVFGQQFEDRVVEIVLEQVRSFIDIGANDGITFSNTFYFAELGAAGLCFEPGRDAFELLQRVHKKNSAVLCINEAIAKTQQMVVLHYDGYAGLLSSLNPSNKNQTIVKTRSVIARPLSYWLDRYERFHSVDLLSIDVEGGERSVLESIDFGRFSAKIIIAEIDNPDINEVNAVYSILRDNGYRLFAKNSFNGFFVRNDIEIGEQMLSQIQGLSDSFEVFKTIF